MKSILKAVMVMAAIIVVQVVLSYVFTWRVAEKFSQAAFIALFYYYVCVRRINKNKSVKASI